MREEEVVRKAVLQMHTIKLVTTRWKTALKKVECVKERQVVGKMTKLERTVRKEAMEEVS